MAVNGLWIGLAAAAGALATTIAGRSVSPMGQMTTEEADIEEIDAAGPGGSGGGGGGGGSLGPVSGMPSGGGGGGGGSAGPSLGPVTGTPSPASPSNPAGGFPGTFPTMGPASTVFGFGGGRFGRRRFPTTFFFGDGGAWWGWPYYYPPAPNPNYVCQWEETPPKEDTKMICTPQPPTYPVVNQPVAWGPPGYWW